MKKMATLHTRVMVPFFGFTLIIIIMSGFRITNELKTLSKRYGVLEQDTSVKVKIILEKSTRPDMYILFIRDSASTTEIMKDVLGKGYGELMQFIGSKQLQPRRFMAWYYTSRPPWSIDIGVETDKLPADISARIQKRVQPGGEVLIAHMFGPYDQAGQAYRKIEKWLDENRRKAKGSPFEVYINDRKTVKSPSEIHTDIYQFLE